MTRLLRSHPRIEVELDPEGRLIAYRWGNLREPVTVVGRWRVDDAWASVPIHREYLKVIGARWPAVLYLDRVDGTWRLERIYS